MISCNNFCGKLLAYALGRSLIPSDDSMIQEMQNKLAANGYRFDSLIDNIVTSPQFLNKRGRDDLAEKVNIMTTTKNSRV